MRKLMMAVMLLACSAANAQPVTDSTLKKRQITFDIKDPLIQLAGVRPRNLTLKITYKEEISERLRWTVSGGVLFPPRNNYKNFDDSNKENKMYVHDIGINPEMQLNSGLEYTKSLGRFTRYLGTELYIKYQHIKVDEYSKFRVVSSSSTTGYGLSALILENKEREDHYGTGLSFFYGYEYKLSGHWALNAEMRYDVGLTLIKNKVTKGETEQLNTSINLYGIMDGLISRVGINYLFYGTKN